MLSYRLPEEHITNFSLTEREGCTGEYWPEVVAVRTEPMVPVLSATLAIATLRFLPGNVEGVPTVSTLTQVFKKGRSRENLPTLKFVSFLA